jgi:hypothetical protein
MKLSAAAAAAAEAATAPEAAAAAAYKASHVWAVAAAVRLAQVLQPLCSAQTSTATSDGPGSSSSSSSSCSSALLLLLWGRILVNAGQVCLAAAATAEPERQQATGDTSAPADSSDEQDSSWQQGGAGRLWQFVSSACVAGLRAVQQLLPAVQLPGAAGSEVACAAAHKQLQQQCSQLLEQLVPANEPSSSSEATVDWVLPHDLHVTSSEAASQLPLAGAAALDPHCSQQLVQFGQALCAQLPLPLCCNNPGCVELRGASEQRLVAGKGSVCSRCRCVAAQE